MARERQQEFILQTLQDGLSKQADRAVSIVELRSQVLPRASSFAAERLFLALSDGRQIQVLFKDLNPKHQLKDARRLRNESLERSRREFDMYTRVFSERRFDTPELYAARWEPTEDRFWIFLEYIKGERLSRSGHPAWEESARWAARFHVESDEIPASLIGFLPRLQNDHYLHWATRLEERLPRLPGAAQELIASAIELYRKRIDALPSLPQSIIHNEFYGMNVLLRSAGRSGRIAPIDWETAAIGPSYVDLASLSSGCWTIWRAYFSAYVECGGSSTWSQFHSDLGIVSLAQAIQWLGWFPVQEAEFSHWLAELDWAMDYFFPQARERVRIGARQ